MAPKEKTSLEAQPQSGTIDESPSKSKESHEPIEQASDEGTESAGLDRDVEKAADRQQQHSDPPPNDPSLVEFDGPDDPGNPKNWTVRKRVSITVSMGMMTFAVTFSSSIFAVAIEPVSQEFNIGTVTATLGVSLFLLGFVLGPIAFGPASEIFGRRVPLFAGYVVFAIFQIPVAVASNVETIMLGRFLSGLAASSPLAVVGGAMADMWDPVERAHAICAFAAGAFIGPVCGPIAGGFVTESPSLGWRWTAWLTLIIAAVFGTVGLFIIPETSAARILQIRAKRLRYETGNWALHAKADENRITLHTITTVYLIRPFVMLAKEPILALLTAYMSYLYGVIYLLFEAYPISFHQDRGWSLGVSALPFVSFIVGIIMGTALMSYSTATNFKRAFIKHGKPIPEERLPPMIIGAVILPVSLLWFAWTSSPSIIWVPQVIASAFLGMGCLVTFWQGINYIVDCYGFYSNSAIAANTFVRSIFGAVFPLFATDLYEALGVAWATSLLGFLCILFLPAPILFYRYGARIRAKSRFIPTG